MSTSGTDGQVVLWDLVDRKEAQRFRGGATRAAFAPSGKWLAVCSLVQSIRIWDLTTGKLANELLGHGETVTCIAWSPDGRLIASGSDDRTVRLWDAATGNPMGVVELDSQIKAVVFSADGAFNDGGSDPNAINLGLGGVKSDIENSIVTALNRGLATLPLASSPSSYLAPEPHWSSSLPACSTPWRPYR